MTLYLDASALVKLVVTEPETAALRAYLRKERRHHRVTSALSRTEVMRAVLKAGGTAVATAREMLAGVDQISITSSILDDAATLAPTTPVRTLDAIHIASSRIFGAGLHALVTYDARMAAAAEQVLLPVVAPA